MPPTVSVVIPTYNRAALVVNAIESVLAQTWADYELIVIDDGSTDDTVERLKSYMDRIRYFHQSNQGVSAAINAGIEVAGGEWIAVLASDDLWLPTKLERQFEAIDRFREDCGACFTNCHFVGDSDLPQSAFEAVGFKEPARVGILDNPLQYLIVGYPPIWVQSLLVRRSLVGKPGEFDESLATCEDLDFLLRLALKTKFCYVAEPLVKIDRTPSRSRLTDLINFWNDSMFSNRAHMYRKWLGLPELVDPEARGQIQENLRNLHFDWMVRKLSEFNINEAIRNMREAREFGDSYSHIFVRLASRAGSKMAQSLRSQTKEAC